MLHGHDKGVDEDEECNSMVKVITWVIYNVIKLLLDSFRLMHFYRQFPALTHFLDLNPASLVISDEHLSQFFLFFDPIKVLTVGFVFQP